MAQRWLRHPFASITKREMILNRRLARGRPCRTLGDAALVPRSNLAFERDLVVMHEYTD